MCYNNTATFDTIGFATSEKRVQGSSTCTCNLSTDGAGVLIRVEMMPSTDPSCGFNKIVLKSQSPFATRMDCRQVQSSRFSVSETASLQQSLQQRNDAPVCMKYTVISGNKKVTMSCSGENLPQTPSTVAGRITSTTTKVTTSSTKTGTSHPVVTSQPTKSVTRTTSFSTERTTLSTKPTATAQSTSASINSTLGQSVVATTVEFNTTTTTVNSSTAEEVTMTVDTTESAAYSSSSQTPKMSTEKDNQFNNKNLGGIIAGSVIGAIVFFILLAFLVVCLVKRRKKRKYPHTHKRMPNDQAVEHVNLAYGSYGETKAYVKQDGASPAGNTKTQTVLENGTPEKPVQKNHDNDVVAGLYATIDKNRMHKADTLF